MHLLLQNSDLSFLLLLSKKLSLLSTETHHFSTPISVQAPCRSTFDVPSFSLNRSVLSSERFEELLRVEIFVDRRTILLPLGRSFTLEYDCGHAKLAVHPDVPTNLGWQLLRASQLLHHPGARMPVATQISYSPDKGDALLEDTLEEENLVEVEVKTEQ
ncbi:hypothetical protein LR48_Vigan303s003700 [Vigna angularis]|uniref:Uncharacterized protein n=1 Tax=Phaseolus angularis TaxID=3914 RepID=A0A0L9T7N9_PHAAN|nr:hypothetical protein LR48_Vigan303s003700 [Vigna angularis]